MNSTVILYLRSKYMRYKSSVSQSSDFISQLQGNDCSKEFAEWLESQSCCYLVRQFFSKRKKIHTKKLSEFVFLFLHKELS